MLDTEKATQAVQDILEADGEGLLDDHGVDPKVAKALAEGIVKELKKTKYQKRDDTGKTKSR